MRYLDPKNDLTFKKIFGEQPELLRSLLNALLPLDEGRFIETLEYLPSEQVPSIPEFKNSIVDVRCMDNRGRQFIVEMQMLWIPSFQYRILFNASKAYVRQLDKGRRYESLQPVYALTLLNDVFLPHDPDFYHHYSIVNVEKPAMRLEGLEFVFVELPKFKPQRFSEKKMTVLWLRFLTEIRDGDESVADELHRNEEIRKALEILQESAFSKVELEMYDRYWDAISVQRSYADEKAKLLSEQYIKEAMDELLQEGKEKGLQEGMEKGLQEGMEKGLQEGMEKGLQEGALQKAMLMAEASLREGLSIAFTAKITGLSEAQVEQIARNLEA
jgi:predicted transposase/invertase (TIGR01784 family)